MCLFACFQIVQFSHFQGTDGVVYASPQPILENLHDLKKKPYINHSSSPSNPPRLWQPRIYFVFIHLPTLDISYSVDSYNLLCFMTTFFSLSIMFSRIICVVALPVFHFLVAEQYYILWNILYPYSSFDGHLSFSTLW